MIGRIPFGIIKLLARAALPIFGLRHALWILWIHGDRLLKSKLQVTQNPEERSFLEGMRDQKRTEYFWNLRKARIIHPDWTACQKHLHRALPVSLQELYSSDFVTTLGVSYPDVVESISCFEPLDEQAFSEAQQELGSEGVIIARSEFGDPIYLRSGEAERESVYILRDDSNQILADSVESMLRKLQDAYAAD